MDQKLGTGPLCPPRPRKGPLIMSKRDHSGRFRRNLLVRRIVAFCGVRLLRGPMTKIDPEVASSLRSRMDGIREWIVDEAPYITADQRHLDANTPERAYWHYGYQAALRDVLALVERSTEDQCNQKPDTSN
jgi:hypothetical protein